jgi:hypothetical protein
MKDERLYDAKIGHQISVFIENRPGALAQVIDILRDAKVNMLALTLNEGLDIGYLRVAVDRLDIAKKVLEAAGHLVLDHEVILLTVANKPGGFAAASDRWAKSGINIEYAYSATSPAPDRSVIIVRVADPKKAVAVLE